MLLIHLSVSFLMVTVAENIGYTQHSVVSLMVEVKGRRILGNSYALCRNLTAPHWKSDGHRVKSHLQMTPVVGPYL